MMAKQLRRPAGLMGGKVAVKMNKANEFLYDYTLDILQPSGEESVLEIGFGNGKFFHKLFSRSEKLKVTGLDFSETMYRMAGEFNKEYINQGRLVLQYGSSDQLPFPDSSFDKIFCINVIYFWDQPQLHLKEMFRVLKPGGRFYATVRTKESMLQMPFTKYGFHFYERDKWQALLSATGFTFIGENPVDEPVIDGNAIGYEKLKIVVQSYCVVAEKKNP